MEDDVLDKPIKIIRSHKKDYRTAEELVEHYVIETALAKRLRTATSSERRTLYTKLYDQLFARLPNQPQMLRKQQKEKRIRSVGKKLSILRPFLNDKSTYLEIGPGDCQVAFAVAPLVKKSIGVDVSKIVAEQAELPPNFVLHISDGTNIPVEDGSVDVAFSDQLMEHLHPEDAYAQLENVFRALKPGGVYICLTPSRLNGPHDISRYFDHTATGFHLHEYTNRELKHLFLKVGFQRVRCLWGGGGWYFAVPAGLALCVESVIERLPIRWQKFVADWPLFRALITVRVVGVKA